MNDDEVYQLNMSIRALIEKVERYEAALRKIVRGPVTWEISEIAREALGDGNHYCEASGYEVKNV